METAVEYFITLPMPLCTRCKSEAHIQGREKRERKTDTNPPHGMNWGERCDRCGIEASVTV